jgi:hypothetical protein
MVMLANIVASETALRPLSLHSSHCGTVPATASSAQQRAPGARCAVKPKAALRQLQVLQLALLGQMAHAEAQADGHTATYSNCCMAGRTCMETCWSTTGAGWRLEGGWPCFSCSLLFFGLWGASWPLARAQVALYLNWPLALPTSCSSQMPFLAWTTGRCGRFVLRFWRVQQHLGASVYL